MLGHERQFKRTISISVVIPTYNNDLTLEETIRSILRFTSNAIVVNDGSTY